MNMFRSMETSASALTAERLRMDLIAGNLANMNTTHTAAGGPYRRKFAVQAERSADSFRNVLASAAGTGVKGEDQVGSGVRVTSVEEDPSPFKLKYDPSNPDADEKGFVKLPNIDMLQEITDMMLSSRIYEANVTAFNASKSLAMKALEIGR